LKSVEDLYKEYSKDVYYYIYSLCNNPNSTMDIMQSTFLSAILSKDRYNGSCTIKTWLFSIAKHEFYKYIKKNKNHINIDEIIYLSISESIDQKLEDEEDRQALYSTINDLEEDLKNIVLLRLTSELSFAEIGRIVLKSEVYCRVNFYRAKQRIVDKLRKGGFLHG
jgi:RNA polymerase sigma factor (sigma-70 family)